MCTFDKMQVLKIVLKQHIKFDFILPVAVGFDITLDAYVEATWSLLD